MKLPCPQCGKTFDSSDWLRLHTQAQHRPERESKPRGMQGGRKAATVKTRPSVYRKHLYFKEGNLSKTADAFRPK